MKLFKYQKEPIRRINVAGFILLLWRRQGGKTLTLASIALKLMANNRGCLVTYSSASILMGRELTMKVASVWYEILNEFRKSLDENQLKTSADGIDNLNDFCDLFEQNRLEVKLYHSRTVFSRTQIIAPNPATARSYSGYVMIDEIGWILAFRDLWEAMEPIASSDQTFRVLMATTPPNDDAHYSYELAVPPEGSNFDEPRPEGYWYTSQSNVLCHRVDIWDAAAAGRKIYDLNTRAEITPDESRARALDRDAWDRNYALILKTGGTAAVSLQGIHSAMTRGKEDGLALDLTAYGSAVLDHLPSNWRSLITDGKVAIGYDPATTEKEKSNPTGIGLIEQVALDYVLRLALRFKTDDPEVAKAVLRELCNLGKGKKPKRICIDATSERYFAAEIKKEFSEICPVYLIISSETTSYMGQNMTVKAYLGNLLVNTIDDGRFIMPEARWLKDDFRSVVRDRGSFLNLLDSAGNHGDVFDGSKNALFGLVKKGGPAAAAGAQVGTYGRHQSVARDKRFPKHSDSPGAGASLLHV
jgi:hypothetical protein